MSTFDEILGNNNRNKPQPTATQQSTPIASGGQVHAVNSASKANATLGTPKFDNTITEVLEKQKPTNFEQPATEAQQRSQQAASAMQDEPTTAQIARAYALQPTASNYDYASQSADTQAAMQKRNKSYAEMLSSLQESMQKYKPLTKEQEEQQRKRMKRDAIISAVGDGLTALSNLVATTKGSPNMYDPDSGLSKRYLDYYEKMKAEREAKRNAYQNYQQLLYNLNNNQYKELASRDAARAEALQKRDEDNRKAMTDKIKLLIEADNAEASGNVAKANTLRAEAQARKLDEEAKWTGKKATAYINNQNAAAGAHKAAAANSYASAAKHYADIENGGGNGSSGGSGSSGGRNHIVLNNGHSTEVVSYNKKRYRDILNVAPDMARTAQQLYAKYTKGKTLRDKQNAAKYGKIANTLSNPTLSSSTKIDIIVQNARDFPQLYHHIRQAVGAEAIPQPRVTKQQPKQRVVEPQDNVKGGNWASGLNF